MLADANPFTCHIRSMKTISRLFAVCAALATATHIPAEDKKPADSAPAAAPAAEASALTVVSSRDIDAIRANDQRKVVMRGKVIRTNEWDGKGVPSKSMNFLDLEGGYFTIVTWADAYPKFPNGHPAAIYRGKTIEVTGTITQHNNRFQMKLEDPAQVRVVEDEKPAGDAKGGRKEGKPSSRERNDRKKD